MNETWMDKWMMEEVHAIFKDYLTMLIQAQGLDIAI